MCVFHTAPSAEGNVHVQLRFQGLKKAQILSVRKSFFLSKLYALLSTPRQLFCQLTIGAKQRCQTESAFLTDLASPINAMRQ